jgi:ATP-dependent DNA helicase RecG
MLTLDSSITNLNKIGSATANKLKKIDIISIRDLIYYFPFRYEDFSEAIRIKDLKVNTKVNIVGTIELIQNKKSRVKKMNITEALLSDKSGTIKVIWFNQPFVGRVLKPGNSVSLSGKIDNDFSGLVMKSPEYEKNIKKSVHTQGLVPSYPLTQNLSQKQLRFLISEALKLIPLLDEWLPENTIKKYNLYGIKKALQKIHFPVSLKEAEEAKKRLGFDELFLTLLKSQIAKAELQKAQAEKFKFKEKETKKFVKALPFILTDAQKKASWEIIQDIEKEKPMSRLLEGDVGSGKTVVAALAMLNVGLNKKGQSALMVPTEILAEQHYHNLKKLFKDTKIKIGLFTRSIKKVNSEEEKIKPGEIQSALRVKKLISSGELKIIIGTHALIQEKIKFKDLGLAIIDEQHRFGVEQRKMLTQKSGNNKTIPHLLSMTATPIPRTLAMTIYGDLDISYIKEMPLGRKAVITKVVAEINRISAYNFIKNEIKKGRQSFVICPLIDISDKLGVASVKEEYLKLSKKIFPNLKVDMIHGKLKTEEKQDIMKKFKSGKTDILVSTSLVEVGVDIPNATMMIIEGADRFGLAQLHQFRGRVGRGKEQSYCFLFTESKSEKTLERLSALSKYSDGFNLSKIDLKFRGPGEVYGIAQKGFPELRVASIFDYELIKIAREAVLDIIEKDPDLKNHESVKEKLKDKYRVEYLRS